MLVTRGAGYYQEYGKPARLLRAGDVVNAAANARHWHGAAPDSWFTHIAVTPGKSQWFEPVPDEEYNTATGAKEYEKTGIRLHAAAASE